MGVQFGEHPYDAGSDFVVDDHLFDVDSECLEAQVC